MEGETPPLINLYDTPSGYFAGVKADFSRPVTRVNMGGYVYALEKDAVRMWHEDGRPYATLKMKVEKMQRVGDVVCYLDEEGNVGFLSVQDGKLRHAYVPEGLYKEKWVYIYATHELMAIPATGEWLVKRGRDTVLFVIGRQHAKVVGGEFIKYDVLEQVWEDEKDVYFSVYEGGVRHWYCKHKLYGPFERVNQIRSFLSLLV